MRWVVMLCQQSYCFRCSNHSRPVRTNNQASQHRGQQQRHVAPKEPEFSQLPLPGLQVALHLGQVEVGAVANGQRLWEHEPTHRLSSYAGMRRARIMHAVRQHVAASVTSSKVVLAPMLTQPANLPMQTHPCPARPTHQLGAVEEVEAKVKQGARGALAIHQEVSLLHMPAAGPARW